MENETKEIRFYNDTLLGVKTKDGKIWLAISHSCKQIGFDERRTKQQGEKIRSDKILSKGVGKFGLLTNGGKQEVYCLEERFVPLWLAKITLTKKMQEDIPDVFDKLEKYQLEAADVLHQAFYETEEQKEQFHERFDLQGEIVDMKETLKIQTIQINSMETIIEKQNEKMESLIDNMTLSTRQQEKILRAGRERVNLLLGGAHSTEYKKKARTYRANLWNNLKADLHCGSSYKDLNPKDFNVALDYIGSWEYND